MTKRSVWFASLMITSLIGPGPLFGQPVFRGIVLTDSTDILLADVPIGKPGVLARAIGYQPRGLSILIAQSDTLRLVFRLEPAPVILAPIVVYVGLATVPVVFARGDSACGVLVLWTRMRRP